MKYIPVKIVHVLLDRQKNPVRIGKLALKDKVIYFEYDTAFLESGIKISPFKLPLTGDTLHCEEMVFEGLFGVFNDSLPDGWGRLLLDRQVRKHGIPAESLTPLDRLTHVGAYGMGALTYEPDVSTHSLKGESLNLDHLAVEATQVLEGEADEVFDELLELSGSSTGARPKIMVGVNQKKLKIIHGIGNLPKDFEHWMIKFASSADSKDIGAIEYAYSLMAHAAGVEMMPTHLFSAKKGYGFFGVQRFDRKGKERFHIHTICGLLHSDHRLPSLDYEQVLKAALVLTRNMPEVEKMFRLAVFNVLSHNRDDHAKNIAFLMEPDGTWKIAPAYDLTFSFGPGGEHSTTVMGEGKNPTIEHLKKLAAKFSINHKTANSIIEEVRTAITNWPKFANTANVSKQSRVRISKALQI
jgi:serine/threonine-protein kinase HipA